MNTRMRNVLCVAVASVALGLSTGAAAGITGKLAEKLHDQHSDRQQDQSSSSSSDQPSSSSSSGSSSNSRGNTAGTRSSSGGNPGNSRGSASGSRGNSNGNSGNSRGSSSSARGGSSGSRGNSGSARGGSSTSGNTFGGLAGSADNSRRDAPSGDRNHDRPSQGDPGRNANRSNLNEDLARLQGRDPDRNRGGDHDRGDYRDGHRDGGRHDEHNRRPPRVVQVLPSGYRDYYWNGSRYYVYGGHWYRPYGGSYITIGIPYGLFVTTLPGYYTSFWYDDTRYFYSDSTYYVYEPARRGYVVTRSPYGDDEDYYEPGLGDDLYVYPAQGQSEQQQADDRYECHRWAVDQTDYNPLDDEYDVDLRADYLRAMTACLTGRGYTVN